MMDDHGKLLQVDAEFLDDISHLTLQDESTKVKEDSSSESEGDECEFGSKQFMQIITQSMQKPVAIKKLNYPMRDSAQELEQVNSQISEFISSIGNLLDQPVIPAGKLPQVQLIRLSEPTSSGKVTIMGRLSHEQNQEKFMSTMGHHLSGSGLYFLPEEIMYLVDRNLVHLYGDDGGIIDKPECWNILASSSRNLSLFLVYRYLKRLGFIVNRCGWPFSWLCPGVVEHLHLDGVISQECLDKYQVKRKFSPEIFDNEMPLDNKLLADFEVWKPNSKFSKRNHAAPHWKLYVMDGGDHNDDALEKLMECENDCIFAIVRDGLVSFFHT